MVNLIVRSRCFLNYANRPGRHSLFLRKVFIANLVSQFLRDRIGRHADINTLTPDIFDQALGVEFEFFG
jgi:hypothetical protein